MSELAGWGNYPRAATERLAPRHAPSAHADRRPVGADRARPGPGLWRCRARNGVDAVVERARTGCAASIRRRGELTVEAGVTIADILATFVPRGFFLKVVPGTKFVSVGGAIAADVHGKNHHRDGGFGDHRGLVPAGTAAAATS